MKAKNGRVGLFEDSDGVISMPKVQALAFTIVLVVMMIASTFTDHEASYEAWAIAALGAGIGIVETVNDRRKVIRLKQVEKAKQDEGNKSN